MARKPKEKKKEVFDVINSYITMVTEYPKAKESSSLSSISTSSDPLDFIQDLFLTLGSVEDLKNIIADILFDHLDKIEQKIKDAIILSIRNNISCNVDPSVMAALKSPGVGVRVDEFDLQHKFKISPLTKQGKSFYFGIPSSGSIGECLQSIDMDTFLWYCIQNNGGDFPWQNYDTTGKIPKNIINLSFNESGGLPIDGVSYNNVFNVKVGGAYKSLNDFNQDYVNSIKFFDKKELIPQLLGEIFGCLNTNLGLSKEEIFIKKQIDDIVDRLSHCIDRGDIDDSFFSFDNTSYNNMLLAAEDEKLSNYEYSKNEGVKINISMDYILNAIKGLDSVSELHEIKETFNNVLDDLTNKATDQPGTSAEDKYKLKLNILKKLLFALSYKLTSQIISPKIYLIMILNMRMLGIKENFDTITFIKKNLNLVTDIVGGIKDAIIGIMLDKIKEMALRLSKEFLGMIGKDIAIKLLTILRNLNPLGCITS